MNKQINSYLEVKEVLKLISDDEINKIPKEIILLINNIPDNKNYTIRYDKSGRLILSKDAEAMLFFLYYEYILADNEMLKKAIDLKLKMNQETRNIIKNISSKKIVLNDLFPKNKEEIAKKCKSKENFNDIKKNETVEMIVVKENKITKLVKKIKSFLKKRF